MGYCGIAVRFAASPSTRREWIEIMATLLIFMGIESPSTRREWIEICPLPLPVWCRQVSLHTEGVD